MFGAREVPAQVKIGLSFIFSAAILPLVRSTLPIAVPPTLYAIIGQVISEAIIGLMLGFAATLLFASIRIGGDVLDYQMGFTQASTFNPQFNDTISPIANFQYQYALVLFLLVNGHWLLVKSLIASFSVLPAATLSLLSSGTSAFVDVTFATLVMGIQIAAPGAALLLITDIAFAFLNRAVPQMQVYYVGMPVKLILGMIAVIAVVPIMSFVVVKLISDLPDSTILPLLKAVHSHP